MGSAKGPDVGTWGSGNFDGDTPADHLGEVTGRLVAEVRAAMAGDPVELEADEYWGAAVPCNLELLALIADRHYVGTELPKAAEIRAWKATYLAIWEAGIAGLGASASFTTERRAVLTATFDRLARLADAAES